jgi:hypothetical protein
MMSGIEPIAAPHQQQLFPANQVIILELSLGIKNSLRREV